MKFEVFMLTNALMVALPFLFWFALMGLDALIKFASYNQFGFLNDRRNDVWGNFMMESVMVLFIVCFVNIAIGLICSMALDKQLFEKIPVILFGTEFFVALVVFSCRQAMKAGYKHE